LSARSVDDRLDELESRTAIAALVARYCHAVDHRDLDLFMSLWHDDGTLNILGGRGVFHGTQELQNSQAGVAKAWARTWHWTTNSTVTFTGSDDARVRSDVFAICERHDDGDICLVGGTYHDFVERRDGAWKFSERVIDRYFVSTPQDIPLPPPS
jgi:hypothetical protein